MWFKRTLIQIDHLGYIFLVKINQEFGLNQDCKTEPVIAKSQACDCKVTKRLVPMQQSNYIITQLV